MCKVLSEANIVDKYKLLTVDEKPSMTASSKYIIGGKDYSPVIAYDMPRGIAIPYTEDSLVGKEVTFA